MSWKSQKVVTLLALAAALLINMLPVGAPRDLVAQKTERASR